MVNLLRGKEKTVEIAKKDEIIESIDELNEKIGSLDEVIEVKKGIDKSIKDAVGTTYAPNIDIRSELPNEMEKFFLCNLHHQDHQPHSIVTGKQIGRAHV